MTADGVRALERAVEKSSRFRVPDHPEALFNRADLARRRRKTGDSRGAIRDYENLMRDLVRVLGGEEPGNRDIGTALVTDQREACDKHRTITEYESRVQALLDRVGVTYFRLL